MSNKQNLSHFGQLVLDKSLNEEYSSIETSNKKNIYIKNKLWMIKITTFKRHTLKILEEQERKDITGYNLDLD